ncbi:hypothetical protein SAY86_004261 [Trapa natans]|uniref:Transmembrane protein n=1 Tax=Trapa natans TaxID=22666 RepID=A0AAN7MFC0_TRANT|nr:hypothetical protein SAY86_004261 [Trapa natans]
MEERGLPGALSMEGVARPSRILRKSIHVFLQHYHYFTLTSALIAFPFSVSFLLSQDFVLSSPSSSILSSLYTHFSSLFRAAKFPLSGPSGLFSIANLKLSQTLSSSFLTLPFTLTFLLFAKASVIQSLGGTRASLASTYLLILQTYVCTWLILLSVNATAFFLMFFAFCGIKNFSSSWCTLIVSAASAVLYSVILANAIIICNLGLVLSGVERISGPLAIVKVILMIRERASTALSLAVPVNIALAATEALFHFRVSMTFHMTDNPSFLLILEGLFIAYMYSVLLVLETTVNLMFLKSCAYEDSLAEFRDWYYFWQIHLEDGKFDFSSSQKYLIGSGL